VKAPKSAPKPDPIKQASFKPEVIIEEATSEDSDNT